MDGSYSPGTQAELGGRIRTLFVTAKSVLKQRTYCSLFKSLHEVFLICSNAFIDQSIS